MRIRNFFFPVFIILGIGIMFYLARKLTKEDIIPPLPNYLEQNVWNASSTISTTEKEVLAPGGIIKAEIMDTEIERKIGLSGRKSLQKDRGLLFQFDSPGLYGFWMKDMRFPIDIVWISEDKTVIGIHRNIQPESYPEVFLPPLPTTFVLELNAGLSEEFGIATGTSLVFD